MSGGVLINGAGCTKHTVRQDGQNTQIGDDRELQVMAYLAPGFVLVLFSQR